MPLKHYTNVFQGNLMSYEVSRWINVLGKKQPLAPHFEYCVMKKFPVFLFFIEKVPPCVKDVNVSILIKFDCIL